MNTIDPVTGGSYEREFSMYVNFHGLTHEEATLVMKEQTHSSRDKVFGDIVQKRWDQKDGNNEVVDISGYLRLIEAVCQQIDKDKCPCSKCKKWKQLQSDWCK